MVKVTEKMNILEQIADSSQPFIDSHLLQDLEVMGSFLEDVAPYTPIRLGLLNKASIADIANLCRHELLTEPMLCESFKSPDMSFTRVTLILQELPFDSVWECLEDLELDLYPGFDTLLDRLMGEYQVIEGIIIQDASKQSHSKNVLEELIQELEIADAKWDQFGYFVYSARRYLADQLTEQVATVLAQQAAFFTEQRNGLKSKTAIYKAVKLAYLIWVSGHQDELSKDALLHTVCMTLCKIRSQVTVLHCFPIPMIRLCIENLLAWAKEPGQRQGLAQAVIDEVRATLDNPQTYKFKKVLRQYSLNLGE